MGQFKMLDRKAICEFCFFEIMKVNINDICKINAKMHVKKSINCRNEEA
jgi:hypothetical protein